MDDPVEQAEQSRDRQRRIQLKRKHCIMCGAKLTEFQHVYCGSYCRNQANYEGGP